MMDFSKGITTSYYLTEVDPETWEDINRMEITGGSISRTDADLRQSAQLTLTEYDGTLERWVRVYMDAKQGDEIVHVPIFTGLATSPQRDYNAGVESITLQCYSVLKAAADVYLQKGYYVGTSAPGTSSIRALLRATPAPVIIDGESEALADEIIAEANESNLTMADKILKAIGWALQIAGDGTVYIAPPQTQPAAAFSPDNDVIETSFSRGRDWFACPNIMRATSGDLTAVARDDDPNSELSTQARGRAVWASEDSVTLQDGETIAQYARRRLKELQQRTETVQYTRRFIPGVNIGDIVRLNYTQLSGDYKVTAQTITLDASGSTQENAQRTL